MSIFTRNGTIEDFVKQRPVSSALIILNSLALIYTMLSGGFDVYNLRDLGGIFPVWVIERGEYYRIFTAAFLHGSIIHFLSNMIIGVSFMGAALEKAIGSLKFFIIYFVAVIGSGILVVFLSEPNVITIGASGGVFGVLGALLYISINRTDLISEQDKKTIWTFVAIQIFFTFVNNSNISIPGHAGGLIAGFLISLLLLGRRKEESQDIYY